MIKQGDLVIMSNGELGIVLSYSEPIFGGTDRICVLLESRTGNKVTKVATSLKKCHS